MHGETVKNISPRFLLNGAIFQ